MVRSLFALFAMLVVEKYHKKTDIRIGVTVAIAAVAGSFVLYAFSKSFLSYCVSAALSGIGYGLGGMIPVSVLISRWFHTHKALALGICAAGTGASTIVAPPLLTSVILNHSLKTAFLVEAAFVGLVTVLVFLVLRNRPADRNLAPLGADEPEEIPGASEAAEIETAEAEEQAVDSAASPPAPSIGVNKTAFLLMGAAIFLIGALTNPGWVHLEILYESEGFKEMTVAYMLMFAGIVLTCGKMLYGQINDKLGAYKSNYLFFGFILLGEALCCFAGKAGLPGGLVAMGCLGLGLPLSTVGLSVYAADVSTPDTYGRMVKRFQITYMVGALVFGSIPGRMKEFTGTYTSFYVLMTVFAGLAMLCIQFSYIRYINKKKTA
jgi:predicted MFS family arabinose efflux permease